MSYDILNRWSAAIVWHSETANTIAEAVAEAIQRSADLRSANLLPIRDDLWAVLSSAPAEVSGLRLALAEGRVNGSTYHGECACLVGTLANVRRCDYGAIPGLAPNSSRPAEIFFLNIREGDTPEISDYSKIAINWIDEWLGNMRAAFGTEPTHV